MEIELKEDSRVELIQQVGSDLSIARAAWTSTKADMTDDVDESRVAGLINYLVKMKHLVPLEHGSITFSCTVPIFTSRQMVKHRVGVSFSEESGRYRELRPVFWIPRKDSKIIPVEGSKPSRPESRAADIDLYNKIIEEKRISYTNDYQSYLRQLELGVSNEIARTSLPVGLMTSNWITFNPRSLLHFLSLRTKEDPKDATIVSYAQEQIHEVAKEMEKYMEQFWPLTYAAFIKNGRQI